MKTEKEVFSFHYTNPVIFVIVFCLMLMSANREIDSQYFQMISENSYDLLSNVIVNDTFEDEKGTMYIKNRIMISNPDMDFTFARVFNLMTETILEIVLENAGPSLICEKENSHIVLTQGGLGNQEGFPAGPFRTDGFPMGLTL